MAAKFMIKTTCLVLLLAAYAFSFSQVRALRANRPPETRRAQALAVDPTLLKVVSGPFKALVADYLNIKASVFMGGSWEVTEEDWEAVYTLLKQSMYIDPLFFQTGYYTQGLLSWRPTMHKRAADLLKFHAEHRYWDWEPMFYAGFDYFYYLGDLETAAECMKASAERPQAPPVVPSLAARLELKSGLTLTSIALLKTMYEQAQNEEVKAHYKKRLQAHLGVYEIAQAIKRFEKGNGRLPNYLSELVTSGMLEKLPENPFKAPFMYNPETGRVTFSDVPAPQYDLPDDTETLFPE